MKPPVNNTEPFHKNTMCLRFNTRFIYNNLVARNNWAIL